MRKLSAFMQITLDGYYADQEGGMGFAHAAADDAEWNAFVNGNASGDGALLFGRKTYEMMAAYWPTLAARQTMPTVAEGMNRMAKFVASRNLEGAAWANTTILKGDLAASVRDLKSSAGPDIAILGSNSIVTQLAEAGLIDGLQIVVYPVALGQGRSFLAGLRQPLALKLTNTRRFANGNVVLDYASGRRT